MIDWFSIYLKRLCIRRYYPAEFKTNNSNRNCKMVFSGGNIMYISTKVKIFLIGFLKKDVSQYFNDNEVILLWWSTVCNYPVKLIYCYTSFNFWTQACPATYPHVYLKCMLILLCFFLFIVLSHKDVLRLMPCRRKRKNYDQVSQLFL